MLTIPTARALLQRTRPRRHADGYPPTVRSQVTALARVLLDEGRTLHSLARELGVHPGTLDRWLDAEVHAELDAGFLPVSVTDIPALEPSPMMVGDLLHPTQPVLNQRVLVSPTGFRLEGLTLDDAVHLLRELS